MGEMEAGRQREEMENEQSSVLSRDLKDIKKNVIISPADSDSHTSLTSLISRYLLRNTNAMFSQPRFCHRKQDTC